MSQNIGTLDMQNNKIIRLASGTNLSDAVNYGQISALTGASAGSISAGATSVALGQVVFSNSNGVSFGLNGSTVTASHNGISSQSNQAASASNGSFTFQTVAFSNANNVTFGTSAGSIITASVNTGLTSQSNQAASASNGSFTFQTVAFSNANNVTFGTSAGSIITASVAASDALSQSAGISNLGNTSGTSGIASGAQVRLLIAGGNNVTCSQSVNGASATVTISAFNQTVESQSAGISNLGNTSGTSGIASGAQVRFLLAGGNNVTLSQSVNGASATVTISAFNQTSQSNTFGMSNIGNTSGTTGVVSGPGLQMVLAGGNNITLSQSINGSSATVTISAFNQTVESQSAGISNLGNTSGTSGIASGGAIRFLLAGGDNITLSQSVNGASATVTISAGLTAGAGVQSIGMTNSGNSSGTSGAATGSAVQYVFVGTSGATLSQSVNGASGTLTIIAPPKYTANVYMPNLFGQNLTQGALVSQTRMSFQRIFVPFYIAATEIAFLASLSAGSSGAGSGALTISAGLYTNNASTWSNASSITTAWSFTSATAGTNANSSNNWTRHTGPRFRTATFASWNITPGDYLLGVAVSTASSQTAFSVYIDGHNFMNGVSILQMPGNLNSEYTNFLMQGMGVAAASGLTAGFEASQALQLATSVGFGNLYQPNFALAAGL